MSNLDIKAAIIAGSVIGVLILIGLRWKLPRRLDVRKFISEWEDLQTLCKDKATWPQALQRADTLLDIALKRRKFKGKSLGERLVSAQRALTNNDSIWAAHNLSKKVITSTITRPPKASVKAALVAYRQALIDLGALPNGQSKKAE
ncbi:hypothetical protein HY218_02695 [Candidatus Saccharibacteria bacterium]|nr:hypothetical protein [Candidatus Saccharibacteria bacterium]